MEIIIHVIIIIPEMAPLFNALKYFRFSTKKTNRHPHSQNAGVSAGYAFGSPQQANQNKPNGIKT